jgi:hypothetical protein
MPAFTSGRYPHLHVRTVHGVVRFHDGRAEATDEQAEVLRGMDAEYGLYEIVAEASVPPVQEPVQEPVEPGKRPAQSANKETWVAWAVAHGMDPDQADDLTKAQLIELADQLAKE